MAEEDGAADEEGCPICMEPYGQGGRRPDLLNCGHVLCGQCLRAIMEAASWWIPCPQCRQNTPTPRGGVTMLDLDLTAFLAVKSEKEQPRVADKMEPELTSKILPKEEPITQQPTGVCQETLPQPYLPQNGCCRCLCWETTAAIQAIYHRPSFSDFCSFVLLETKSSSLSLLCFLLYTEAKMWGCSCS
uniref:Ring finger protein 224 n=1 Tax=Salvator merianae TaxID=96440 RepID=A0A8D0ATW7_SALMN